MATGPILDDRGAYGVAWNALPLADRRRITRAVSKGEELDDGDEAQLAVMTARRQIGFWRWAWVIGPAVALIRPGEDLAVWIASIVMSTVATLVVAWFFVRRARRGEAANIELAERSAKRGRKGAPHPKSKEGQRLARMRAADNASLTDRLRRWLPFG